MSHILVSLVSEQAAPNLLLLLDPVFKQVDQYLFISTPEMQDLQQVAHLQKAAELGCERIETITVSAYDPQHIFQALTVYCQAKADSSYSVNLTGGTKMMSLAVWAFFSRPEMQAAFFYVSLGENNCRRIFPIDQTEIIPLSYRFSLRTYLTAYGISEQEAPLPYRREAETERLLFQGCLNAHQPLPGVDQPVWWFANHLGYLFSRKKKKEAGLTHLSISEEPWIRDWLKYLKYTTKESTHLSAGELRYLQSAWFEHYIHDSIRKQLQLPAEATASQIKLHHSDQHWKYTNHEFDIIFLYRNRLYIIECKTAIRRNRPETKRLFNEALYRLAALKRDFGLNVSVGLVLLTDQLRKGNAQLDPQYARRAKLFDLPIIDQQLLAEGASNWVPILCQ